MQTGTRAEFAAHRAVHRSTVMRWHRAGKLVYADDGAINFDASIKMIEESADPVKQGVTLRHARERGDRVVDKELFDQVPAPKNTPREDGAMAGASAVAPPAGASGSADSSYVEFNRARALKEAELAKLAKMKREEQEGLLIRREKVAKDIESLAAMVSKGLTSIPARIMPLINSEPDPGKREQILEAQIHEVLVEFADKALALVGV